MAPLSDGLEICYQSFGDPAHPTVLLVMGLGGPMNWWNPELCRMIADRGFHVVRYDNRDTGRSSKIDRRPTKAQIVAAFLGRPVRAPYGIGDLAGDAFALLDHLGVERAHVAGVSMGGFIAQTMALEHPERVLSLTSIMSSTGRRTVGFQHPRLFPGLLMPRGAGREAYIRNSVRFWRLIESPAYPDTDESLTDRAAETFDRGFSATGVMRQMLAVLTQPDRTADLGALRMPVTVVHGLADRMVHASGGRATRAAIRHADLLLIDGMGHDLPVQLHPRFADAIVGTAHRAR